MVVPVLVIDFRPFSPGECGSVSEVCGARVAGAQWLLPRLFWFLGEVPGLFGQRRFLFCGAGGLGSCVEEERRLHLGPERGRRAGHSFHLGFYCAHFSFPFFIFFPS